MTDTKEWVLPNGFTFIASTAGYYGAWAKATDPVTAARNAAKSNSNNYPQFVYVWYAPDNKADVNEHGGLTYSVEDAKKIVPVGFYELTKTTMKPSTDERLTHENWMADSILQFQQDAEYWKREKHNHN
jgi:hypothetical protein